MAGLAIILCLTDLILVSLRLGEASRLLLVNSDATPVISSFGKNPSVRIERYSFLKMMQVSTITSWLHTSPRPRISISVG